MVCRVSDMRRVENESVFGFESTEKHYRDQSCSRCMKAIGGCRYCELTRQGSRSSIDDNIRRVLFVVAAQCEGKVDPCAVGAGKDVGAIQESTGQDRDAAGGNNGRRVWHWSAGDSRPGTKAEYLGALRSYEVVTPEAPQAIARSKAMLCRCDSMQEQRQGRLTLLPNHGDSPCAKRSR